MLSLLSGKVLERRAGYANLFRHAAPFPHLVIDDFFEETFCRALLAAFPPFERGHALTDDGAREGKSVVEDLPSLGPAYARADELFGSAAFTGLIAEMTGISGLLHDPDYVGGGTHENMSGQDLDLHVDFNHHPRYGWHRRLNLIVYLNPEWDETWGGTLELHRDPWLPVEEQEVKRVLPVANRAVLFETSERSWHGFQSIATPPDRSKLSRKSLAIYLYTRERPAAETAPAHSTVYVDRALPIPVAPGPLSSDTREQIQQLLMRRTDRLEDLMAREAASAKEIVALVGSVFSAPGGAQVEDLERLRLFVGRETEFLRYLYEREKDLSHARQQMRARVAALALAAFPLTGPARLIAPPRGFHPRDGWCEPDLSFELVPTGFVRRVTIHGDVPALIGAEQTIACTLDGRIHERSFPMGQGFSWLIEWHPAESVASVVHLHAAASIHPHRDHPGSSDQRHLAFVLKSVQVE